jgi:hypothetical protein
LKNEEGERDSNLYEEVENQEKEKEAKAAKRK